MTLNRKGWKGFKSPEQFFARYADRLAAVPEHQKLVTERKFEIRFLDYDWGLNDAKR